MRYIKVTINRDETSTIPALVGAWEVPVLEAVHGAEKMTVEGYEDHPNRPWPDDAASEMQRLNRRYKPESAADGAPTRAEEVYGKGSLGVKALARAIAEAKAEAEAEKPRRGRPAKDSLLGEGAAA